MTLHGSKHAQVVGQMFMDQRGACPALLNKQLRFALWAGLLVPLTHT